LLGIDGPTQSIPQQETAIPMQSIRPRLFAIVDYLTISHCR